MNFKCKNFMFGDWIKNYHNFPMQVKVIGEDYLYADFEGNEGDVWEFDDEDNPPYGIPIDDDVLIKNGFVKQDMYYRLFLDDHTYFEYYPHEHRLRKHIGKHIAYSYYCFYVHELQRTFRSTGDFELADNFKV